MHLSGFSPKFRPGVAFTFRSSGTKKDLRFVLSYKAQHRPNWDSAIRMFTIHCIKLWPIGVMSASTRPLGGPVSYLTPRQTCLFSIYPSVSSDVARKPSIKSHRHGVSFLTMKYHYKVSSPKSDLFSSHSKMSGYDSLPAGASPNIKPFKAHVSDDKLNEFMQLIKVSPIGPVTYENSDGNEDRGFGMTRKWLVAAKDQWLNKFDWRAQEDYINSFPNYTVQVTDDDGEKFDIHFAALFSKKKDAIPIAFFHGWPGQACRSYASIHIANRVTQAVFSNSWA